MTEFERLYIEKKAFEQEAAAAWYTYVAVPNSRAKNRAWAKYRASHDKATAAHGVYVKAAMERMES